jgi:uncharacterized protein (TIGR02217 family)
MSSLVFPTLAGQTIEVQRSYIWKSQVQESPSGKQSAIGYMLFPLVQYQLSFDWLNDAAATSDLKALQGLHNAVQGRADFFLFTDPDFNSVTAQNFGTGDGVNTAFLVTVRYQNSGGPGTVELIQAFNGAPSIYVNGVLQTLGTAYTLANGVVTFLSGHIPAASAALTWTGSFYYQCRFDKDNYPFAKFMNKWWALKQMTFKSLYL